MLADAVFEGGGVKGVALVGALWAAEAQGYTWENVAGTSAGAIVAALVAAGYTASEIKNIMYSLDFRKFKDTLCAGRIPVLGPALSIGITKGLYKGDYFIKWLRGHLAAKGVRTFGDLIRERYRGDKQRCYRLRVIAADISRGRMLILPQDIAEYGMKPEKLEVANAIRMSMSIPLFYRPVQWGYKDSSGKRSISYIVDGGILSNYPVWLFDKPDLPNWPTFGFRLVESESPVEHIHKISGPISLLSSVMTTMMEAHDRKYIKEADFARTIAIPTLGVRTTDFELSEAKREALFQSGLKAGEKFFREWDFRAYTSRYTHKNP
ncbi:MAG: patatin-like phospholipase family protein [Carboxydocellales bacterium]